MFFPSICFIAFLSTAYAQLDGLVSGVGSWVRSAVSPLLGALQGVSDTVKKQLFEILNENNIPMADQLSQALEVVTDESDDVQAAVQALFDGKQDTFVPALQKVATNLGPRGTKVINQLKTIVQDQTLSAAYQCNQVQQVVSKTAPTITKQLKPIESMACNALKGQIPTQNGPVKLSNILGIDVGGAVGGLPLVGGTAKNLLGGVPLVNQLF